MKFGAPLAANDSGARSVSALDIIHHVLEGSGEGMKQRFQDPKILTRSDVGRPFYYILASVPIVTGAGLTRKRQAFHLGFCDETTLKQAKATKQQVLAPINSGRSLIQSQIPFRDVAKKFESARIPQLGAATQAKYLAHLENHVLPAFHDSMMCEITKPAIEAWLNRTAEPKIVTVKHEGKEVSVEREGLSWWTRMDLRNLLSAIFTKAAEWSLWDGRNPCEGVSVGKKKVKRAKRIPSAEDLARFLGAIRDSALIDIEGCRHDR